MVYHDSSFRVRKDKKGWVVEVKKPKWTLFGIKYKWVHTISFSGLPDSPYFFRTRENAIDVLTKEVRWGALSLS